MLVVCRTIAVHLDDYAAIVAGRSLTIADLIQQRQAARQQKDFATADQIRDRLAAIGITVVDQPDGEARWHRQ
jgi:cysteinyl-tRNA synthetase